MIVTKMPAFRCTSITPFTFRATTRLRPQRRLASTVVSPTSSLSSASTNASVQPLTWNRFLQLRRTRRRISLAASITFALGAFAGGAIYIGNTPDIEAKVGPLIGLDPLITMGIMTFACGAAGWLVGPFIGAAVFGMRTRSMSKLIAEVRPFEQYEQDSR